MKLYFKPITWLHIIQAAQGAFTDIFDIVEQYFQISSVCANNSTHCRHRIKKVK